MSDSTRDVYPGLGAAIRQRREAMGWSLSELAARSSTHFTALSKVERGQRAPSFNLVSKIAAALGISLDALQSDAGRLAHAEKENQKKADY